MMLQMMMDSTEEWQEHGSVTGSDSDSDSEGVVVEMIAVAECQEN